MRAVIRPPATPLEGSLVEGPPLGPARLTFPMGVCVSSPPRGQVFPLLWRVIPCLRFGVGFWAPFPLWGEGVS